MQLMNGIKPELEDITSQLESAASAARSEVYAKEGAKYSTLKSESDSKIALLEQSNKYQVETIASLKETIEGLTAQVKDFPAQLKEAVAAAKADVTINQDNKK